MDKKLTMQELLQQYSRADKSELLLPDTSAQYLGLPTSFSKTNHQRKPKRRIPDNSDRPHNIYKDPKFEDMGNRPHNTYRVPEMQSGLNQGQVPQSVHILINQIIDHVWRGSNSHNMNTDSRGRYHIDNLNPSSASRDNNRQQRSFSSNNGFRAKEQRTSDGKLAFFKDSFLEDPWQ